MAQCKLTPREFISNTFSPKIGAICSPAAEYVCQKNNLTFIELLQPFSNLNSEGHIKDPQGTIVNIRNLHLSIQDINSQPPEPTIARKLLNDSVNIEQCERTTNIKIQNTIIDIPISVPWFESWREMFLNVQFPSDHEFTKHFIACMIVVATSDNNPLDKIQQIAQKLTQQTSTTKLPKWFNNNTLRYYILIYDSSQDDKIKAEKIYTDMKNIYDKNNCYLLSMNSRKIDNTNNNVNLPDPWCQFLIKNTDDIITSLSDTNSSPRTPADTGCVSSMPNRLTTSDSDKTSQAGTPVSSSHNPILSSPNDTDKISLTSELNDVPNIEIGQEAVPVLLHPLSPVNQVDKIFTIDQQQQSQINDTKITIVNKINDNVWADTPSHELQTHGALLSTQDLEKIRQLINEFCIKSLLPYIEKQLLLLNDIISNKKGVSRSLFTATKRWFGTSKPGAPNSTPSNAVIYSIDSAELQLRRFGDLCFMIGHYSLAYQAYHSAKRDFQADQAWLYYAGALEMAGLSAFMQGENDRKTIQYLDDAILTYLNTCKMSQFAVRATLLSSECLKGRSLYNDAAKQLIKMTSEDSDLRSALLLEQASYCYIFPKMLNKYAFHCVLAGHRYSKAGQKKHSLRCYQQAYQVYHDKGWSLAEDHIHFTIGRQAASLKQINKSIESFEKLLNPLSKQSSIQQQAFLREFLQIQNLLIKQIYDNDNTKHLPILILPLIDNDNNIKIHCGNIDDNEIFSDDNYNINDENKWCKLEEILVTEIQGTSPMLFKQTVAIYSNKSNNTVGPIGIVDEPIYISFKLYNPLRINLSIGKIKLIWNFKNNDDELITNENDNSNLIIESSIIDTLLLKSMTKQQIVLSVVPKFIGELKILGISYYLTNIIDTNDNSQSNIIVNGKKLFTINEKKDIIDKRLDINIIDKSPFLKINFTKLSQDMICGEIQKINMTIKNIGNSSAKNLLISSKNIDLFCIDKNFIDNSKIKSNYINKILINNNYLEPNKTLDITIWIKAPHKKGNHKLDLLFYYENNNNNNLPKYRLHRHSWLISVLDSINIKASIRQSILTNNNLPTLNLVLKIKNSNQVHDPFMNEITLTNLSLKSNCWIFDNKIYDKIIHKIQPQEIYHLLLKLNRRIVKNIKNEITNITFVDNNDDDVTPYINFIDKLKLLSLSNVDNETIENFENLNITLIIRWKANIMEGKCLIREAIGQHHLELNVINQIYKHPEDVLTEPSDYPSRLIIFGPDRNVPNTDDDDDVVAVKNDNVICNKIPNNIITFSLRHQQNIINNFEEKKICLVPVTMTIQNHSNIKIQVKIDTIGTSSQTYLPSIKSQLYTPKASTFFRYACHTAINCDIEPLGYHIVELQAIVLTPGTFDFASRIEISAKTIDITEFISQKWKIESVCSISDVNY